MKSHSKYLIQAIDQICPNPEMGVEVGSWHGENAQALLKRYKNLFLITIDRFRPLDEHEAKNDWRMAEKTDEDMEAALISSSRRTRPYEDRRIVMVADSPVASRCVPNKSLDFVFIDGHHAYDQVKRDLDTWYPKVKIGGLISGHDYRNRWSGKRAIDEFFKNVSMDGSWVWYVKK